MPVHAIFCVLYFFFLCSHNNLKNTSPPSLCSERTTTAVGRMKADAGGIPCNSPHRHVSSQFFSSPLCVLCRGSKILGHIWCILSSCILFSVFHQWFLSPRNPHNSDKYFNHIGFISVYYLSYEDTANATHGTLKL